MRTRNFVYLALLSPLLLANGNCQHTAKDGVMTEESQVEMRQMQTRSFDTANKTKTLRSVIDTLQDLSFVVDKADSDLGTVTATKLDGYNIVMTVTVKPRDKKSVIVRANAQYQLLAVKDPEFYQNFFTALGKSMFLTANNVD